MNLLSASGQALQELVSVDPGLRGCGVARWLDGRLYAAGYVKGNMLKDAEAWRAFRFGRTERELAIEFPQVYRERKTDPEDLLQLAAVVGTIASSFEGRVTVYRPRGWKGTVPKGVMGERILSKLFDDELSNINRASCPKHLIHNVIDSVGIGLRRLGRL